MTFLARAFLLSVAVISAACLSRASEHLATMRREDSGPAESANTPRVILRTPSAGHWQSAQALLRQVADGRGPANAVEMQVLHRRLLQLSGEYFPAVSRGRLRTILLLKVKSASLLCLFLQETGEAISPCSRRIY